MADRIIVKGNSSANNLQGTDAAEIIYGYDPNGSSQPLSISATRVASGLTQALFTTSAPNDPNHLLVVQKTGQIRVVDLTTGQLRDKPFLDVSSQVSTSGEQGLLGFAFDPNYATNGKFYVYMSNLAGDVEVRQYTTAGGSFEADPASGKLVTTIDFPVGSTHHRGGWIGFGPEGYLYVAVGDGEQSSNAQNISSPLGKILRLDVTKDAFPTDPNRNYAVPTDNPSHIDGIAGDATGTGIYAAGLRNPWRASFDHTTGELYIADVGESTYEEINLGRAGANYGWPGTEGGFDPSQNPNYTQPIYFYAHTEGRSITGGYVYRGENAALNGQYVFGDFVTGSIWTLDKATGTWTATKQSITTNTGAINRPTSFGEDANGNLYVVDYDGEVFRLNPQGGGGSEVDQGDTIYAYGGDDIVYGGAGNDTIDGGNDHDLLYGDDGNDSIKGGEGNDTLLGGQGADTLDGGGGLNTISYADAEAGVRVLRYNWSLNTGEAAGDVYVNTSFSDLIGSSHADYLKGWLGAETIYGGNGKDTIEGFNGNDYLDGQEGDDTIRGEHGNDTLVGADGNDSMSGGDGQDTLYGGFGNDVLFGRIDNDELDGGYGNDRLEGDEGNDIAYGRAGDDKLLGGTGNDTLDGGDGWDRLDGGIGDDVLIGSFNNDTLDGGDGKDSLYAGEDDDTAYGRAGDDFIVGGTGNDRLYGDDGYDILNGGEGGDFAYGGAGDDGIVGGGGMDWLFGMEGNDYIYGGDDSDYIHGGTGSDLLVGEGGHDHLITDGSARMVGGAGYDIFRFTATAQTNVIADFEPGWGVYDQIALAKSLFDSFDAVRAAASQNGSDVVIAKTGFSLTLQNMTLSKLVLDDFTFF